ncbi:MAG TPA: porin family protein [Candidatus Thiothrix moscowensis]|uniref:porin family protein n=1 Tax=unclassified Thiothrix TaxID=2636184 RepID=UPI001A2EE33D|nr:MULTISPECIES: porin family protein [unclassified Thiothrix]MBJ6609918.1 porin family protein [Candidatus Thiothrix moscowensis]HRJ52588.1 porin family protein [Candidatus Thiothrix moscowensis]HRJ94268.1 porin family protein [Candidatus Thiothrix moscowensis]
MKKLLLGIVLSISVSVAFAVEEDSGAVYVGVSAGKTAAGCDFDECDNHNWKLFGGYEITPSIAAEAAYQHILNTKEVEAVGMSLSGLYKVPVSDKLDVFGKAGMMAWRVSPLYDSGAEASNTDFIYGAGSTYKLNENWGVRGEYEHIGGDLDANMYSLGAVFSSL